MDMTKRIVSAVFAVVVCMALAFTSFAASKPRLYDGADILTASEESKLLERLNSVSDKFDVEIAIATVESLDGYTADRYVNKYYDENSFGFGDSRDGVILLIAMQEREYRILSNGLGARAVTADEIDYIGDSIAPSLSDGDYYDAFNEFIDECEYEINGEINGFPFDFTTNILIALVVGFIVAFIVTGTMKAKLKSVRMRSEAGEYIKHGSMKLTKSYDFFLYRTVSRRRKENNTSSSSRSSGSSRNVGGGRF